MGQSTEAKSSGISNKALIIAVIIATVAIIATIITVSVVLIKREENASVSSSNAISIGYAADAKVMLDKNELQAAMDEAMENAKKNSIGLKYKNNAYSNDGINFECYIANSSANIYDMFLTIYEDSELENQLFLSELVPPGSGFENISLEHKLGLGDHTVYVSLTQVDVNEEGEQVIVGQAIHTMEFHVS